MNGLTGMVKELYNSFDSDIEISAVKGKCFSLNTNLISKIKKINGVLYLAPCIEDDALLKYFDKQSVATVKGVSSDFFKMTNFKQMIKEGSGIVKKDSSYFAILGEGLAYQLGANINSLTEPISFYAPKRENKMNFDLSSFLNEEKIVPRSYFSINDEFDSRYAIVHIDVARKIFGYENEVTTIEIGLVDSSFIEKIQKEIQIIVGDKFNVKNRFQQNKALFSTLQTEKLWTFMVLVFILMVATFNIIGALTMLILEKKKDIITLSNLGAETKLIRKIFLSEGVLIVLMGTISGLLLGLLFCLLQLKLKFIPMQGTVTNYFPVEIQFLDFFFILISVFVIGSIAAWLPVRFFTKKGAMDKFRMKY